MKTKKQLNILMKTASIASIVTAVSLAGLKLFTFLITGSVAILSSLFDSAQDLMSSIVNLVAIRHATEPADKHHRFGHGKAQALGGLIQGFIIFVAAAFLLKESCTRFAHPQPIAEVTFGIIVTVIAIIATLVLLAFQTYVIRLTGSLSLKADRAHYTGDIMMNVGVITSMLCAYFFDWLWIDALFGVGVAVYLFVVVWQIAMEAFAMLMDTEMPDTFRKEIQDIARSFPEVKAFHNLKTRSSGDAVFVQFCLQFDETMTLRQAHDIIDLIEDKIKEAHPNTETLVHAEPYITGLKQNDFR